MNNTLTTPYVWKTHDGRNLSVTEMETSHLFNTIKMVWNHSCPPELQLKPFLKWNLNRTPEELGKAIEAMLIELSKRSDITVHMVQQINQMRLNQPKLLK